MSIKNKLENINEKEKKEKNEINNNKIIFNNNNEKKDEKINNKVEIQQNKEKDENSDNNDAYDYRALCSDKILGRFTLHDKICIINKLNIIVYGKIKKELLMELKAKKFENKLLLIKSRYKTDLILEKKLHSLVQEKMLRDFNFKKNLKDLRKKLMDEKIEKLKYKNLLFIMRAYGIYREDHYFR